MIKNLISPRVAIYFHFPRASSALHFPPLRPGEGGYFTVIFIFDLSRFETAKKCAKTK